jgi:recombinational DNA repair ATPase RecF
MLDDVQTIITTTDLSMIDSYLIDRAKVFEISCGKVVNEVERKVIQNGE